MNEETEITCETCNFFAEGDINPNNITNRTYFCKRYPPSSLVLPATNQTGQMSVQISSVFPMTAPESWCGEWENENLMETQTETEANQNQEPEPV